ncbi:MAG: hypothetical protein QXX55_01500, partial [Candidatus Pacearchaeota archaeon]
MNSVIEARKILWPTYDQIHYYKEIFYSETEPTPEWVVCFPDKKVYKFKSRLLFLKKSILVVDENDQETLCLITNSRFFSNQIKVGNEYIEGWPCKEFLFHHFRSADNNSAYWVYWNGNVYYYSKETKSLYNINNEIKKVNLNDIDCDKFTNERKWIINIEFEENIYSILIDPKKSLKNLLIRINKYVKLGLFPKFTINSKKFYFDPNKPIYEYLKNNQTLKIEKKKINYLQENIKKCN